MDPFQLTDDAVGDIDAIWLYLLNREGVQTADRIVADLFQCFYKLAEVPNSGHRSADLTSRPVLFYKRFSYLILYTPRSQPLQTLSVLHGKRNVSRILRQRL